MMVLIPELQTILYRVEVIHLVLKEKLEAPSVTLQVIFPVKLMGIMQFCIIQMQILEMLEEE